MTTIQSIRLVTALSAVVVLAVGGCSMPQASDFKPSKLFSLGDDEEPQQGVPTRIVCTWADTVLTKPGQVSQRGFGGRLLFYDRKEDKPILIDGQLVVYAFDESNRAITDNKPTRRYVFPPEQLPLHMSESELGASYSFWLPWDEVGGPQTEVSLICRFEPKGGGVIASEQTKHRLPGTIPAAAMTGAGHPQPPKLPEGVPSRPAQPTLESVHEQRIRDYYAQQASYQSVSSGGAVTPSENGSIAAGVGGNQQMETTSIALPPKYRLPTGLVNVAPAPLNAAAVTQPSPARQQIAPQPQPVQTPALMQPMPQQPQAMPPVPNATPIQQPMTPGTRLGHLQAMPSMSPTVAMPTVASPTVHVPTGGTFGGGVPTMGSQPIMPHASAQLQVANPQTASWTNVQKQTVAMGVYAGQPQPGYSLQPQPGYSPQMQQPQRIVQSAGRPLPPATGLTTTVSYPTPATALR